MRKLLLGLLAAAVGFTAIHLFESRPPHGPEDHQDPHETEKRSPSSTTERAAARPAAGEMVPVSTVEPAAADGDHVRLPWVVAAACIDQGLVRKANEDRFVIQRSPDGRGLLVAVSDGMGGHKGGGVAAQIVVDALREAARSATPSSPKTAHDVLLETFHRANVAVREKGRVEIGYQNMGATCVAAWLAPGSAVHLYTGDSRLYHIRGDTLRYRTRDHSLVQALLETGVITPAQARIHPMRSWLSSAIGGGYEHFDAEPRWNPEGYDQPALLNTQPGDILLLCSDGLPGELEDDEILVLVKGHGADPAQLANVCVETALAAGGHDNVTVIAVRVVG